MQYFSALQFPRIYCLLAYVACSVLLLILSAVPAQGQLLELQVTEVESDRNFVFRDYPEDAAIVIESSISGLDVSSNIDIIEDKSNPSQGDYKYIIYAVRQQIYISAPGFKEFSYGTGNLNARDVIFLSVEPEDTGTTQTGDILVRSEPEGATITLDGLPGEYTTPYTFTNILAQSYTMRVELEGYQTEEVEIRVDPLRPNVEDVELELSYGFVTVNVENAELFVSDSNAEDEYRVGFTPGEPRELDIGEYSYRIEREHYQENTGSFTITPGGNVELSPRLDPDFATLQVSANVEEINVAALDNDAPANSTPNQLYLEKGLREVIVSAADYEEVQFTVRARPGETIDTTVTLESVADARARREREELPKGILNLKSDVPDAHIYINDQRRGQGEINLSLTPDTYEIEVRHEKLSNERLQIVIPPAEVVNREIQIRPAKGTTIFLSTILPGTGHLYSNRSRGYLYLMAALAAAGFSGYSYYEFENADKKVEEAMQDYRIARNISEATQRRQKVLEEHNNRRLFFDRTRLGIAAFTGVYVLQFLDLNIFATPYGYRGDRFRKVQASLNTEGASLTLNF